MFYAGQKQKRSSLVISFVCAFSFNYNTITNVNATQVVRKLGEPVERSALTILLQAERTVRPADSLLRNIIIYRTTRLLIIPDFVRCDARGRGTGWFLSGRLSSRPLSFRDRVQLNRTSGRSAKLSDRIKRGGETTVGPGCERHRALEKQRKRLTY